MYMGAMCPRERHAASKNRTGSTGGRPPTTEPPSPNPRHDPGTERRPPECRAASNPHHVAAVAGSTRCRRENAGSPSRRRPDAYATPARPRRFGGTFWPHAPAAPIDSASRVEATQVAADLSSVGTGCQPSDRTCMPPGRYERTITPGDSPSFLDRRPNSRSSNVVTLSQAL